MQKEKKNQIVHIFKILGKGYKVSALFPERVGKLYHLSVDDKKIFLHSVCEQDAEVSFCCSKGIGLQFTIRDKISITVYFNKKTRLDIEKEDEL